MIFNNERLGVITPNQEILYSCLFKSLRSGNEQLALYTCRQIKSISMLKVLLIIFICENCPMLYMLKSFIDLKLKTLNYSHL